MAAVNSVGKVVAKVAVPIMIGVAGVFTVVTEAAQKLTDRINEGSKSKK